MKPILWFILLSIISGCNEKETIIRSEVDSICGYLGFILPKYSPSASLSLTNSLKNIATELRKIVPKNIKGKSQSTILM